MVKSGGVGVAEFDRFIKYMGAEVLGGPALCRYMFEDLGRVDREGRPEDGCTLWWFLAHLDPTATKISTLRDDLTKLLKRGSVGRDEVVRTALGLIGDARAALGERGDAARVREFGGSEAQTYPAQTAVLLRMLDAAEATVRSWRDDPSYVGNSYFMARPSGGKEFTSTKPVGEAGGIRKYSTQDDAMVQQTWSFDRRRDLGEPGAAAEPDPSEERPSAPSTPSRPDPARPVATLPQADAVRGLIAADVIEYGLDGAGAKGLAEDAAGEVGKFFGPAKPKLLSQAAESAAAAYAGKDAGRARSEAEAILKSLGLQLSDVRAFRGRLADGLTLATLAEAPAASAAKADYAQKAPEFQALAEKIDRARRVTAADVQQIVELVEGLDFATIAPKGMRSLQDYFQQSFCYRATPDSKEMKALTDVYWKALHGLRDAKAARAAGRVHDRC
jgi:hypothetical protein